MGRLRFTKASAAFWLDLRLSSLQNFLYTKFIFIIIIYHISSPLLLFLSHRWSPRIISRENIHYQLKAIGNRQLVDYFMFLFRHSFYLWPEVRTWYTISCPKLAWVKDFRVEVRTYCGFLGLVQSQLCLTDGRKDLECSLNLNVRFTAEGMTLGAVSNCLDLIYGKDMPC